MPRKIKVNYFPHDYGMRNMPQILGLRMKLGMRGLGIFWCLIEMLWENGGSLPCQYDVLAYEIRDVKEDELRLIVEQLGLFRVEDGMIISDMVNELIAERVSISSSRAESGRQGGVRSGQIRRMKASALKEGTILEANALRVEGNASIHGSYKESKEIEKEINQSSYINEEDDLKKKVFETLFFRNIYYPGYECNRFWEYYSNSNWTTKDGQKITDIVKVAQSWRPKKSEKRFPQEFLLWYKQVFNCVNNHNVLDDVYEMITGLTRVSLDKDGVTLRISYKSKETSIALRDYVMTNNLNGKYKIDWRVDN